MVPSVNLRRRLVPLLGLVTSLVFAATACYLPVDVPSYALEAADEPCVDYEARELDEDDTARWQEDGRLFVETRSDQGPYRHVQQVWVSFAPGVPPRVEMRAWSQECRRMGATWPKKEIQGSSWVSGGASDLIRPDGPGLTIQARWRCMTSGSDQPGSLHLRLRPDQIAR
jgi:hypothetical protein